MVPTRYVLAVLRQLVGKGDADADENLFTDASLSLSLLLTCPVSRWPGQRGMWFTCLRSLSRAQPHVIARGEMLAT